MQIPKMVPPRISRPRFLTLLLVCSGLAACGGGSERPRNANGRLQIVTTTAMVGDMVRAVAGDRADVVSLMGEGVDPHLYKPTRDDVTRLNSADVVVYSGLALEGRMVEVFERLSKTGKAVFAVTDELPDSRLREPPDSGGHFDPHVWMDCGLWSDCVPYVAKKMGEIDPPHKANYAERASAYEARLKKLDAYAATCIQSIPAQQRLLITAHDAFGYFSQRYGIEVFAPQGISTESEASAKDINDLVELIVTRKVPALFFESSLSSRNIRAILEGVHQRNATVTENGPLFSDAMGAAGTYEGTYEGMFDHNVTLITRSLGGEAPRLGLNGRLAEPVK